ncbi:ABC transporter ATP-binding protein [Myroides pelagicus]|uniref:ATP-binding cassette domain-containing protein n=1 Tax=Myroides pelagicus TaxID=270914 RepID=A0A7K1GML9_9FLAO|nr:ABC transporter ATP-binding protein [Myroides pelagicus]MEC4113287.1 ABC transporter ATP-binding protein [Myroides pelagicus]MTH29454.1 ATP-binding cassette domain-containing protein [Myroides pelagicus]
MQNNIIDIEHLYKQYEGSEFFSVKDLSLVIKRGVFFGILGPNGAGKTTLISMLCGLIKPTSGKLLVNELSYTTHANLIKQQIGVVPQEYALYPTLTAFENLCFLGSMYGLKGKVLKERVNHYLDYLGLEVFKHKRINTYSGGMKRRVNLIAGILHEPSILFLDEPTVGVDLQSRLVIVDFLKQLHQKGTTIIYTSHHLAEVEELCTQIAIIDRGTIYALGTGEDLKLQTGKETLEQAFLALTGTNLRDDV